MTGFAGRTDDEMEQSMRLLGRTFFCLVAAVVSGAAAPQPDWIEFKSTKYGFSFTVPVAPRESAQAGRTVLVHAFLVGDETAFCNVLVSDYREAIDDALLTQTRDVYIARHGGLMTTSQRRTLSRGEEKLPAIEFDLQSPTMFGRAIIAIDGSRVYQISGGIPLEAEKAGLERCVRSFKLIPKS
jgi:hypothetical protein